MLRRIVFFILDNFLLQKSLHYSQSNHTYQKSFFNDIFILFTPLMD